MSYRKTVLARMLLAGWALSVLAPATWGSCADPQRFSSVDYTSGPYFGFPTYVYTPGVEPYTAGTYSTISADFHGSFWALGAGDPTLGAGVDHGTFVGYAGYPYFGDQTWVYTTLDPIPAFFVGDWSRGGIDGCIDDVAEPRCMAVLLSDQFEGDGFFALATARAEPHGDYDFTQEGHAIHLAPVPAPVGLGTTTVDGETHVDVTIGPATDEGLYPDLPDCTALPIGYKIYQQTVAGGPAPADRERTAWQLAIGGQGAAGAAIPLEQSTTITVSGCVPQGQLYLAASLVFDSGFETVHLSANSLPVDCGPCQSRDDDEDGFAVGACTPRETYDCDDADATTHPGAPQACDGVNNDCVDPVWPSTDETNEADPDGDGLTACAGDPCPHDPEDDIDMDGLCAGADNCPFVHNPCQLDEDGDGAGRVCDSCPFDPANDADSDGLCANFDTCPLDPDNDLDDDGVCADMDNCRFVSNPSQTESDQDGVGDACDRFGPADELGSIFGTRGHVAVGDMDGDGDHDVLAVAFNRDIVWYRNEGGTGTDWSKQTITSNTQNARTVEATDLDGDGDLDVLFTAATATFGGPQAGIAWYENVGGQGLSWQLHALPVGTGGQWAGAADFDGDGSIDVVGAQTDPFPDNEDFFFVFFNADGSGTSWTRRTLAANAGGAQSIVPADVDLDGDVDVFTASRFNDTIAWYENGDPAWTRHLISYDADGPIQVFAADVDGDGDIDVLSASALDDTVAWYENPRLPQATSMWITHTITTLVDEAQSVFAGDVDLDGDLDVISSGRCGIHPAVLWHENLDGAGTRWEPRGIDGVTSCFFHDVHAADLDGDGDLDALAAAGPRTLSYRNATCDGTAIPPQTITGVTAEKLGTSGIRLTWSSTEGADTYSATRGSTSALSTGQYGSCVASGLSETSWDDFESPAPGEAWTYLVAGNSVACGLGGLGVDSTGTPRVNLDPGGCSGR